MSGDQSQDQNQVDNQTKQGNSGFVGKWWWWMAVAAVLIVLPLTPIVSLLIFPLERLKEIKQFLPLFLLTSITMEALAFTGFYYLLKLLKENKGGEK